ncbi:hypothetical protein DL96DRAFT_1624429 [Flagelloscypha sp. PMI_526]|nr:hypothetical protein DL96DRAFT_1624429 [Flagelloscypha sp. PMI_526]
MEIARHIFMLSAEDGQRQWKTLSLVSSQVQRWLDPFFFRYISPPSYSSQIWPLSSRILRWAKSFNVAADIPGSTPHASSIALTPFYCLNTIKFKNLGALSAWDISIPTLRNMYIGWDPWAFLWESPNRISLPRNLMVSLTHIHLNFNNCIDGFPWRDLSYAENLVFLVVDSAEAIFSHITQNLKTILNTIQSRISEFSAAPLLEVILWVYRPITFPTEEWHGCNDVPIDDKLILGAISVAPDAECDFGKFCVIGVKNEYRPFDIWSLEGQLLDRARAALRTRTKEH